MNKKILSACAVALLFFVLFILSSCASSKQTTNNINMNAYCESARRNQPKPIKTIKHPAPATPIGGHHGR